MHAAFPLVQLIRPGFSLVTVPSSRGGTRTEFGDIQLLDVAVLPWPSKETGLLIGVGPTLVIPTATSRSAGQGAWQAGPAMAAVYKGIPWLVTGFVLQDPISFAYTSRNRPPQNTIEFQPILAVHVWKGWYVRSAEATWICGLHHRSPTVLPLSLGVGDDSSSRVAAAQLLRDGAMDGLSAIRARRSPNRRQLRVHRGFSRVQTMVSRAEFERLAETSGSPAT